MDVLFDILLVVLVVMCIWDGWKRGILAMVLVLAGWGLAVLIISLWTQGWAEIIYHRFLEAWVVRTVDEKVTSGTMDALRTGINALQGVQGVLDQLRGILGGQVIDMFDLQAIQETMQHGSESLAQSLADHLFQPLLTALVRTFLSLLILMTSLSLFGRLSKRSSRRSRGLLGTANRLLGAGVGAVIAYGAAYLYALVLSMGSRVLTVDWLTPEILERTVLVKRFL